jgi:hypothetical protein
VQNPGYNWLQLIIIPFPEYALAHQRGDFLMLLQINKVHCLHKFILFALVFSLTLLSFYSCGEKKESAENQTVMVPSDSFTFFDLSRQSILSKSVRNDLKQRLGRDAIEHRGMIDLDINFYGFLKKYFPALYELNRTRKENIPFDHVELVFSNYSQHPLLFRINFQKDEANIIEKLKTKYGQPLRIDWNDKNGQSMYWEKNNDVLIVSLVPDQFGNPEYQIRIYFVENIKVLLATESAEKEKAGNRRAKSGKTAF